MDDWNYKIITKPPEICVKYERKDLEKVAAETNIKINELANGNNKNILSSEHWLQNLKNTIQKSSSQLYITDKFLQIEYAALASVMYQNGQLRNEKFMQVLKKINKCMKHWKEVKVASLLSNILQMFPSDINYSKRIRLPTTRSMHFLLLRMVGCFHLVMQGASYCVQAASFIRPKIMSGHFFATATVLYAFVSRIRALFLDIAAALASTYDEIFPYIGSLIKLYPIPGSQSLPSLLTPILKMRIDSENQENNEILKSSVEQNGRAVSSEITVEAKQDHVMVSQSKSAVEEISVLHHHSATASSNKMKKKMRKKVNRKFQDCAFTDSQSQGVPMSASLRSSFVKSSAEVGSGISDEVKEDEVSFALSNVMGEEDLGEQISDEKYSLIMMASRHPNKSVQSNITKSRRKICKTNSEDLVLDSKSLVHKDKQLFSTSNVKQKLKSKKLRSLYPDLYCTFEALATDSTSQIERIDNIHSVNGISNNDCDNANCDTKKQRKRKLNDSQSLHNKKQKIVKMNECLNSLANNDDTNMNKHSKNVDKRMESRRQTKKKKNKNKIVC